MSSSDNFTSMDTSEPEIKKKKQNNQSGTGTKGSGDEKLMKCPNCPAEFAPSVTFRKEKDGQCELNIGLHQDNGDDLHDVFKKKLDWTNQAAVTNYKMQCPNCEYSFPVRQSVANKMGGFDIEFSFSIPKDNKLEGATAGETQSQNGNIEMDEDNGDGSSSQKSTESETNYSTAWSLRDGLSYLKESSKGWFVSKIPKTPTPYSYSGKRIVKVHYTPTSDTFGADAAIINQLKNKLKSKVHLEETTRRNCSIIIVFCPVSSSYESEVKFAMEKGVSSSGKQFILVLMHHTRDPYYSTAGCDASEVLRNVFYVHVFYHETVKGLLKCSQNEQAMKLIEGTLLFQP